MRSSTSFGRSIMDHILAFICVLTLAFLGNVAWHDVAHADPPPASASKAPVETYGNVMPDLSASGWKITSSYRIGDATTIVYERSGPRDWSTIKVTVRPYTSDDTPATSTKIKNDGSSENVVTRVIVSSGDRRYLVKVVGEWPTAQQSAYAKDLDTVVKGVRRHS